MCEVTGRLSILTARCDVMSLSSSAAESCRSCVRGRPRSLHALLVTAGCEARDNAKRRSSRSFVSGKGKAGLANSSESSMRLRYKRTPERGCGVSGRRWVLGAHQVGLAAVCASSRTSLTRSTEDALSSRISTMRNTATPMRSGFPPGKLRVSKAQFLSGNGMLPEANAGSRKARGIHDPPDRPYG